MTSRYSDIIPDVNNTAGNLATITSSHSEVSPYISFAVAVIFEAESFVIGASRYTFVSGVTDLAERHQLFIGGEESIFGSDKAHSGY